MPTGTGRLYQKRGRWYADFRDFADVGGGQEALIPDGSRCATKDDELAEVLMARRLMELHERRAGGTYGAPTLADYRKHHLEVKAGYRRESTVDRDRQALAHLEEYLGEDIPLDAIGVRELTQYVAWRRKQPGRPAGTTISAQTILHELHALSNLYRRAIAEGHVETNPVRQLPEKPSVQRQERVWLEHDQAGRLLRAAKAYDREHEGRGIGFMHPLLATYLLTGGRRSEVLGLERRDVDRGEALVRFRENDHRRLKRAHCRRYVPLWPQLAAALEDRLERIRTGQLLFPSPKTDRMLTDFRKPLRTIVDAAGLEEVPTPTTFRHTYAAARLQTLDGGEPVSVYTVAQEMGHKDTTQIEETYGHLMRTRHRTRTVRFEPAKVVQMDQWRQTATG
jgi:integrase